MVPQPVSPMLERTPPGEIRQLCDPEPGAIGAGRITGLERDARAVWRNARGKDGRRQLAQHLLCAVHADQPQLESTRLLRTRGTEGEDHEQRADLTCRSNRAVAAELDHLVTCEASPHRRRRHCWPF